VTKFFIPDASPETTEEIYASLRGSFGADETRVRSIRFWDNELRREIRACVGEPDYLAGEVIAAILRCPNRDSYLVLTRKRGVARNSEWPIEVGRSEVRNVEEFEP
jgi:hypothetical protein